jgi:hypothetical protein
MGEEAVSLGEMLIRLRTTSLIFLDIATGLNPGPVPAVWPMVKARSPLSVSASIVALLAIASSHTSCRTDSMER